MSRAMLAEEPRAETQEHGTHRDAKRAPRWSHRREQGVAASLREQLGVMEPNQNERFEIVEIHVPLLAGGWIAPAWLMSLATLDRKSVV